MRTESKSYHTYHIVLFVLFIVTASIPSLNLEAATNTISPPTSLNSVKNDQNKNLLNVTTKITPEEIKQGGGATFNIRVLNTSHTNSATNVRIMNMLPQGFKLKMGTVMINGIKAPDPLISSNTKTVIFKGGDLTPDGFVTITFETEVTAEAKISKAFNYVSAISSGGVNSNITKTVVQIIKLDNKTNIPRPSEQPETAAQVPIEIQKQAIQPETTPKPEEPESTNVLTTSPKTESIPPSPSIKGSEPTEIPVSIEPAQNSIEKKIPEETSINAPLKVPAKQTLTELVSKTELSVLSDSDGAFVKNMAMPENSILQSDATKVIDDTSIAQSIRAGRSFNRESLAALARTDQAKAQTGQAFGLLLPSLSIRANTGFETSDPSVAASANGKADTHSRTDLALTFRQPLFDLPSFVDWKRRKVVEQSRNENYRINDGDAYISTVNAYLSLVSTRLQTDMTREFENQLNDLLIYIEKRAKAGAASYSDMARVRARSQATHSSILEQESAHAAAGVEFVRLTNTAPQKIKIPEPEDLGASTLPSTFDGAVSTAMKSNPEISTLYADIKAAELDQSGAKARYLPKVDAEYTDNFSLHASGATSSAGQRDQRYMMVLNWNLFSGGSDYYNVKERISRQKELQYKLDDQKRRVVQTLSANYATLVTTRNRISSGYEELKSISTAADAMSKRMLSGNQSLLDLLDVYDRFYQVRSRLVTLHILEMSTISQLVRLTNGTPAAAQ